MRPVFAGNDHVGLQQHALQPNPLIMQRRKNGMKDCSGDLLAAFDRMRSVHQHFRLDDRNEILFLTEGCIPRQRVRIGADAGVARQSVADMDDCAPLRETGAHIAVLDRRSRSPSRPSVTVSPAAPASGFAPASTLMPGKIPWFERTWTSGVPSELVWRIVSSCMMTPLMNSATPAVKSISR